MYTVKIMNEHLHGPIWVCNAEGVPVLKYPLIYNDSVLMALNERAAEMFTGYYEFDSHNVPCWFNHEKEKRDKDIMLDLIAKIVERLNAINDGNYIVEDLESSRLKSL